MTAARERTLLVLAVAVAYAGAWRLGYLSDDFVLLEEPLLWLRGDGFARPLPALLFALEEALLGAWPALFHGISLALHVSVVLLLRRLYGLVLPAPWPLLGALLFAVAPVGSEAVYWLAAQNYLVEANLLIATLLAHAGHVRGRIHGTWPGALAVLALLTRESALVLPAMLIAWDLWLAPDSPLRERVQRLAIPTIATAAYLGLYIARTGSVTHVGGYSYVLGANVPRNIVHFALSCVYLHSVDDAPLLWLARGLLSAAVGPPAMMQDPRIDAGGRPAEVVAILLGLAVLAALVIRGRRDTRLGLALFALAAAPFIALRAPLGSHPSRFCYVPLVGMVLALTSAAAAASGRTARLLRGLAVVAAASLALATFTRGLAYHEATQVTGAVLDALDRMALRPGVTYVVHGVPDSVQHAYVFRNGLPQAVRRRPGMAGVVVLPAARAREVPAGAAHLLLVDTPDGVEAVPTTVTASP